ncbi:hypothetical protein pipiens_007064 [Culex pipiens pipiens]|uniref:Protein CIP2A n=1 Tax=Culex pipiens pipiens TaxID=38569 RepID=A0ABD1DMX8_CULPP
MSSFINDFNNHIQAYFISSTYGNETLVTNNLNHLALVQDQRTFDVSVYSTNVFFVNLHKLMGTGTKKMALMWSAVSVLEAASKWEETRLALVRDFHYLPPLTNMLLEIHSGEQQQRLLALIELLTHGAQLESHEPFVEALILRLLALMEQGHGHKDKTELVTLALSILVNLCYRNLPMTYLLTKNISVSAFCGKIKELGLVACKMYIILERNDFMKEMDLQYLLKMSFKEVRTVLASKNSFILRHVVDYLHYIRQQDQHADKENGHKQLSMKDNFFRDNLKEFLDDIERHTCGQLDSTTANNTRKKRKCTEDKNSSGESSSNDCMDVLFEIMECIVALEPVGPDFRKRIADVALKWITTSKQSCARAVDLLRVVLERSQTEKDKDEAVRELVDACQDVLAELMAMVTNNTDEKLTISFSKLLSTMVKVQSSSSTTDLDNVAEQFFQHVFATILSCSGGPNSFNYSLADSEVRIFLWALHTFNDFANLSPTLWFAKVGNLLKQKPVHFMIARGLTSGDLELTEAMMQVTATVDFPRREVSKMVGMLSGHKREKSSLDVGRAATGPMPPPAALSRELLERMSQTVSQIQDAVASGQISDVSTVELIEFYNCKIAMETQLMSDLRGSLGGMSAQISTLLHQNQLQAVEIDKVQRKNLPLVLKVSALENENRTLEKELNHMKSATASYDRKIGQMKHELSDYIRKYSEKNQQCGALAKEVEMYRVRDGNYEKENKRLQHELNDMTKTRDESRKLLKVAEDDRQKLAEQKESDKKMYESKIREREREISKRTDLCQQLEHQLQKRDTKIELQETELKDLLGQIAAKEERIAQIENELKESESIQKAIYSLMNKGKK